MSCAIGRSRHAGSAGADHQRDFALAHQLLNHGDKGRWGQLALDARFMRSSLELFREANMLPLAARCIPRGGNQHSSGRTGG
jgi:hypothetical protein